MKKFLSILLAFMMVFAVAVPVFAETLTDGPFKIGSTYYADLKSALAAAKSGDTIDMMEDVTDNSTEILGTVKVDVTINGNGYTYTAPKNTNRCIFQIENGANVTINYIDIVSQSGINVKNGTLTFNDSHVYISYRTAIKFDAATTSTANINNSVLEVVTNDFNAEQGEPVILLNATVSNTLNLTGNSKLIKNTKTGGVGNGSVINIGGSAQHTTVNLGTGSEIVINQSNTTTGKDAGGIHAGSSSGAIEINFAKDSVIRVDSVVSSIKVLSGSAGAYTAVNDAGVKIISKTDVIHSIPTTYTLGENVYSLTKMDSSTVSGYDQYALAYTSNHTNFTVENEFGKTVNVTKLSTALNAAKDGSVIILNNDFTTGESGLTLTKNITIDLNQNKLTCSANAYFISSIKKDLTFKNGSIDVMRGMIVQAGGHLTLNDVDYTVTPTDGNARPAVKLNGAGATEFTAIDSYVKTKGYGESLILVEQKTDGVINLEGNTTLEFAGTIKNSVNQNNTAIVVQQAWGTGVDGNAASSNTDLVLNVGANATLKTSAASNTNAANIASIVYDQTKGDVTINIEEGATFEINRTPGVSKSSFITIGDNNGTTIINDNGANWVVDDGAAAQGVTIPTPTLAEGETLVGYAMGGKIYKTPTAAGTYTAVKYTADDFDMIDGASLRTVWKENGIRFSSNVSLDFYDALGDNAVFGTIIAPGTADPTVFEGEKLDIVHENAFFDEDNGVITNHAAVVMPLNVDAKTAYELELAAVAYFTVTFADGTTQTYYTAFDANNVRSMEQVAKNLNEAGVTNRVIAHILEVCA